MKVVYQDSELIVVDKPSGLLSVPGRGPDKQDCVVNRVKQLIPDIIDQPAVHRLDMDTSGLMILAKRANGHRQLSKQFERKQVRKKYIALVEGVVEATGGQIRLRFRLDPENRPLQIYDPVHGKLGITNWERLCVEKDRTRIAFTPRTGRTHQLRLHAAHPEGLGMPIVGDRLYGNGRKGDRMRLHACQITFRHPNTDQEVTSVSEVPF